MKPMHHIAEYVQMYVLLWILCLPRLKNFMCMYFQMLGLLADAKSVVEVLEKLQVPADRITELYKDIENMKKQVADQEYNLGTRSQGSRSLEDIGAEIRSVEEKR